VDEPLSSRIHARRAIEALRAGVPNHDAVTQLGTAHADIEERFREHLEAARAAGAEPRSPAGFLIAGNFGTGKSHLLEYLQQIALAERFVVSKVVISKETPLSLTRSSSTARRCVPRCCRDQAESRSHRLGQQHPVNVYSYTCEDTIEERIDQTLRGKQLLFDELVDDVSLDLGAQLSAEELFSLFELPTPR
jgi:hypothetical protein